MYNDGDWDRIHALWWQPHGI
jgi:hypothetical protein